MSLLETRKLHCPYCGEPIELVVDGSAGSQSFIEDCSVCCQPIEFAVTIDSDGDIRIVSRADHD